MTPTRTRARVFDRDGFLLIDSRSLYSRGDILRFDLPPPAPEENTIIERTWNSVKRSFGKTGVTFNEDADSANGRAMPEVMRALAGSPASVVRVNANGDTIVSVAVPIQRFRAVRGALLLSTQGGDIDGIIAAERWAILRIFLVAAGVMIVLSVLLRGHHRGAIRRLSAAAERVRRGVKAREEIPDFTDRSDEIGHLSGSLRDMTRALYNRIEAIESFAADVAHELKNPLTSLRSAVETMPLARSDESRGAAARRHPARREAARPADQRHLRRVAPRRRTRARRQRARRHGAPAGDRDLRRQRGPARRQACTIRLDIARDPRGRDAFVVIGHDSRLGQVISNLVENARSFSQIGGEVRVTLRRTLGEIEIAVEDDGPGVPPTPSSVSSSASTPTGPEQGFGQNSGLGLSISRADRRGASRPHLGREPPGPAGRGRPQPLPGGALHRAPAGARRA